MPKKTKFDCSKINLLNKSFFLSFLPVKILWNINYFHRICISTQNRARTVVFTFRSWFYSHLERPKLFLFLLLTYFFPTFPFSGCIFLKLQQVVLAVIAYVDDIVSLKGKSHYLQVYLIVLMFESCSILRNHEPSMILLDKKIISS